MTTWARDAACKGKSTDIFYDDIWPATGGFLGEKVAVARKVCEGCPVRRACLATALEDEKDEPLKRRFGLRAGLTPSQRHSLVLRGTVGCDCGRMYDPLLHAHRALSCDACGKVRRNEPLGDRGDAWAGRHSTLSKQVVKWLIENSEPGDVVPSPTKLAAIMEARPQDVQRIYRALTADGTLVKGREKYRRKARAGALAAWVPPHLAEG